MSANLESQVSAGAWIVMAVLLGSYARAGEPASATLPLDQLLKLQQDLEQAKKAPPLAPPVAGSVSKLELSGRIFNDGMEVSAHLEVNILSNEAWVSVPLLRTDPRMSVVGLPELDNATIVRQGENLTLVMSKAGSYSFDLSLVVEAEKENRRRKVELAYPGATLAVLRVSFDENLFHLIAPHGRREPEGYLLYPRQNQFSIEWEQLASVPTAPSVVKRPPVQPLIERGVASIVSTLEGQGIVRVLLDFRCDRPQPMQLELPKRQELEKVFLNGASIPFTVKDRGLRVNVEPARAGDQSGKLELILVESLGRYHLSGLLTLGVPKVDWPVNEMFLQVHLPSVFLYRRVGGTMEETKSETAADFTQKIPTPGKRLTFHQFLITASAPQVELAYDVELSGSYFR